MQDLAVETHVACIDNSTRTNKTGGTHCKTAKRLKKTNTDG